MAEPLSFRDTTRFLTRKQVAKQLGISLRMLDGLILQSKLHPIRQGQRWVRFFAEEVDAYVAAVIRDAGFRAKSQNASGRKR